MHALTGKELLLCLGAFLLAVGVAAALTPLVRRLAFKVGAVDVPNERRINTYPLPNLGGLALFAGFVLSCAVFVRPLDMELVGILLGAVFITAVGAIDGIKPINPWPKLFLQTAAAVIPVLFGLRIEFFTNIFASGGPPYVSLGLLSAPLTVFWIVFVCNSVNLIDGLDGLACGISTIAALSIFLIVSRIGDPVTALIIAALAGSCLGFLPFNFSSKKKIIMGDSGALFLGYILAAVSVYGMFKWYTLISFAVPFLVIGFPLFETVFSYLRRLLTGKNPFKADRKHIHHRLLDLGMSQKQVVAVLYTVSGILGLSAVVLSFDGEKRVYTLLIAMIITLSVGLVIFSTGFARKHKNKNGNGDDNGKE